MVNSVSFEVRVIAVKQSTMPKIGDRIKELNGKPFYSFEYFPPKTPAGVQNLYERVERMGKLEPLFVDITWGAGGSTSDLTLELRYPCCADLIV